jgi:hypothetical protein
MDGRPLAWFAAGAATAAALSALLLYSRSPAPGAAHRSAPAEPAAAQRAPGAGLRDYLRDDVLSEQLTRNIQFFGTAGQDKIVNSFVVVVGLGVSRVRALWAARARAACMAHQLIAHTHTHPSPRPRALSPQNPRSALPMPLTRRSLRHPAPQGVGSHAAHLLLRSGVGKLRLIDFDQVTVSSLNRHALATREDVGISKAACLEKHFRRILPEVRGAAGADAALQLPHIAHIAQHRPCPCRRRRRLPGGPGVHQCHVHGRGGGAAAGGQA